LREAEAEFGALNVAVAVVTFDAGPLTRAYLEQTGLSWPLLIDHERKLYDAYGMLRARNWDLFRPSMIWHYLKLLAKGRRLRRPGSDVYQLGGDVLVDPAGMVRLHHVSHNPADRPAVESILNAIRAESPE
jgi:alkyl hydroperoxide reductase subunit AhpC